MLAYLGWLVENGFFAEARMYFLHVGHTHCIIDQRFSQVRTSTWFAFVPQRTSGWTWLAFVSRESYCIPAWLDIVYLSAQVHKRITQKDLLTPNAVMELLGTLFKKDGERVFRQLEDVADWYSFFKGYSQAFVGTGTARTPNEYYGRSIHAMRVTLDSDKKAVIQYKEFDTDHEPWQGHWNTQLPIRVFPTDTRPEGVLQAYPREVVKNLAFVEEKVDAVLDVLWKTIKKGPPVTGESDDDDVGDGCSEERPASSSGSDSESDMDSGEDRDSESVSFDGSVGSEDDTTAEHQGPGQSGQLRKGFSEEDVSVASKFWRKYLKVGISRVYLRV